jgi:uroporphyrinogen-III synthase
MVMTVLLLRANRNNVDRDALLEFGIDSLTEPYLSISMKSLPSRLVPAGFDVVEEVFYATEPVHDTPRSVALIAQGVIGTVLLRSPSAARTFFAFNPHPPSSLMVVCGGETTAAEVRALGFSRVVVAPDPSPAAIARVIASLLTGGPR